MLPPFSARLPWSAAHNALSLAVEERRAAGLPLLDLTQSNPTAAGLNYPRLWGELSNSAVMRYEPDARGLMAARLAVTDYYGGSVSPDRVLMTASTSEAYSYLFKLLCDPGDEVLVPRPSYPLFEMLASLENVRVRQYPLRYHDGWFIDLGALHAAVTDRTRAVIWVNPNNPTGSFLHAPEYTAITTLCAQRGLALISDEVFADYPLDPAADAVRTLSATAECLCFTLSGLSKVSGLPQMKLAWIAAAGPGHEHALDRLEWIADTFLSVSAPVQHAAAALLDLRRHVQPQIVARTKFNLAHLQKAAAGASLRALRAEGGWYATVQVPRVRSEEGWTLDLLDRGVLVQPGFFFDFESEAFLVLSLLTEPQVFQEGLQHILDAC